MSCTKIDIDVPGPPCGLWEEEKFDLLTPDALQAKSVGSPHSHFFSNPQLIDVVIDRRRHIPDR